MIIDHTQQNSKYRLCGERDGTNTHIISECNKLAQEDKIRLIGGKVIHWELCKKFKFDHKFESVPENETHILLWDFEIQTDHLTSVKRPDLKKIKNKKENLPNS